MKRRIYTEHEVTEAIRSLARSLLGRDGARTREVVTTLLELCADDRAVVHRIANGEFIWAEPGLSTELNGLD